VGRLLYHALDHGIDFVDSSAAYRWSEELIAKYIGHRRHEFTYATKWFLARATGGWRMGANPRLFRRRHRPRRPIALFGE